MKASRGPAVLRARLREPTTGRPPRSRSSSRGTDPSDRPRRLRPTAVRPALDRPRRGPPRTSRRPRSRVPAPVARAPQVRILWKRVLRADARRGRSRVVGTGSAATGRAATGRTVRGRALTGRAGTGRPVRSPAPRAGRRRRSVDGRRLSLRPHHRQAGSGRQPRHPRAVVRKVVPEPDGRSQPRSRKRLLPAPRRGARSPVAPVLPRQPRRRDAQRVPLRQPGLDRLRPAPPGRPLRPRLALLFRRLRPRCPHPPRRPPARRDHRCGSD